MNRKAKDNVKDWELRDEMERAKEEMKERETVRNKKRYKVGREENKWGAGIKGKKIWKGNQKEERRK